MNREHNNHMWLMALACGGGILLSFVLPLFGLSKNWSFGIAIAVMISLHFLLIRGSHENHKNKRGRK